MTESELYHHGIKGQKWGVRRFQNPDGTLTEAGKTRLRKDLDKQTISDSYKSVKKDKAIMSVLNPNIKKLSDLHKKMTLEPLLDEFDQLSDEEAKGYYREALKRDIADDVTHGRLDPVRDKKFIEDTYNLKTEYAIENSYAYEDAFNKYMEEKHPGELKKRAEYGKQYSEMAKQIGKEFLDSAYDRRVGTGQYTEGMRFRSVVADLVQDELNDTLSRSWKTRKRE